MQGPRSHVRVDFSEQCSIGPGKVGLLEGIERTGSLSAAARDLGMSYRRAWLLLHSINAGFGEPAAELAAGGRAGGGARLTDFGRRLVSAYRQFEAEVEQLAATRFAGMAPGAQLESEPLAARRPLNRSLQEPAAREKK